MLESYRNINYKFWNREYSAPNVESFIFRLKSKLLDLYIKKSKKIKILDYGCGEGANIKYFIKNHNYDGYGVDISPIAIKNCHKKNLNKKKFKKIDLIVNENDNFFNCKFDLIISIQTLYYLNNNDLKKRLISFYKMLKPGGYVFFTMMGSKNENIKFHSNRKKNYNGLTRVNYETNKEYKKRQKQNIYYSYINYTKNEKDLKKKFKIFKPLNIGFYDSSLISLQESGYHYTFFGKK